MKKQENDKDLVVRMIWEYRAWYAKRVGLPVQYSSQNAYVIEYNTMKGIKKCSKALTAQKIQT